MQATIDFTPNAPAGKLPLTFDEKLITLNDRLAPITIYIVLITAMILSFSALQAQAANVGFTGWRSWLWPILIDGVILSQSLTLISRQKRGFSTRFNWFLLIIFEAVSIFINARFGTGIEGWIMHGLPPLIMLLVSKAHANDIKDNAHRLAAEIDQNILQQTTDSARMEVNRLTEEANIEAALEAQKTAANGVSPLTNTSIEAANRGRAAKIADRRKQVARLREAGKSKAEIARILQVSADTVQRDCKAIEAPEYQNVEVLQ